jgi:hypothetical protein
MRLCVYGGGLFSVTAFVWFLPRQVAGGAARFPRLMTLSVSLPGYMVHTESLLTGSGRASEMLSLDFPTHRMILLSIEPSRAAS